MRGEPDSGHVVNCAGVGGCYRGARSGKRIAAITPRKTGLALRKRLLYREVVKNVRPKNPAAVALGSRGGQAGVGAAKRRGNPDYYRRLVARRKDRQAGPAAMRHRHLNHQDFTLAAIDDIIGRGQRPAWEALRLALIVQPEVRDKVLRVCAAQVADPAAQRYHFWNHYARARQAAS